VIVPWRDISGKERAKWIINLFVQEKKQLEDKQAIMELHTIRENSEWQKEEKSK